MLPPIEIVDMRREMGLGDNMFSQRPAGDEKNLEANEQTVLFINRRVFREIWSVPKLRKDHEMQTMQYTNDTAFEAGEIVCHYCGNTAPAPKTCPHCKSVSFIRKGIGTEKLKRRLKTVSGALL